MLSKLIRMPYWGKNESKDYSGDSAPPDSARRLRRRIHTIAHGTNSCPCRVHQATSASPVAAASAEMAKSSRGNIVKKPGDGASVTDKGKTVQVSHRLIKVDAKCPGKYASKPENGHFVALDVSMETIPELAQSVNPQFGLAGYAWKAIAANGTTFNGNVFTGAAYMCLDDAARFPSALGPGEKATGKIILDVPTTSGVLVHQQGFMPTGWEWAYPAK